MSKTKEVFLGGTTNKSDWRDRLISMLEIEYFNPVVSEWNEAAQAKELDKRANSDYVLYVITPKMEGVYSIAEVIDDSNKRPEKTIFCVLPEDDTYIFTVHQMKSLVMTGRMVQANGGTVLKDLEEVANYLNTH